MHEFVGLIKKRDALLSEQRELSKQRPRGKTDEHLSAEIARLESLLTVARDDLVGSSCPLRNVVAKSSAESLQTPHRWYQRRA